MPRQLLSLLFTRHAPAIVRRLRQQARPEAAYLVAMPGAGGLRLRLLPWRKGSIFRANDVCQLTPEQQGRCATVAQALLDRDALAQLSADDHVELDVALVCDADLSGDAVAVMESLLTHLASTEVLPRPEGVRLQVVLPGREPGLIGPALLGYLERWVGDATRFTDATVLYARATAGHRMLPPARLAEEAADLLDAVLRSERGGRLRTLFRTVPTEPQLRFFAAGTARLGCDAAAVADLVLDVICHKLAGRWPSPVWPEQEHRQQARLLLQQTLAYPDAASGGLLAEYAAELLAQPEATPADLVAVIDRLVDLLVEREQTNADCPPVPLPRERALRRLLRRLTGSRWFPPPPAPAEEIAAVLDLPLLRVQRAIRGVQAQVQARAARLRSRPWARRLFPPGTLPLPVLPAIAPPDTARLAEVLAAGDGERLFAELVGRRGERFLPATGTVGLEALRPLAALICTDPAALLQRLLAGLNAEAKPWWPEVVLHPGEAQTHLLAPHSQVTALQSELHLDPISGWDRAAFLLVRLLRGIRPKELASCLTPPPCVPASANGVWESVFEKN